MGPFQAHFADRQNILRCNEHFVPIVCYNWTAVARALSLSLFHYSHLLNVWLTITLPDERRPYIIDILSLSLFPLRLVSLISSCG